MRGGRDPKFSGHGPAVVDRRGGARGGLLSAFGFSHRDTTATAAKQVWQTWKVGALTQGGRHERRPGAGGTQPQQ